MGGNGLLLLLDVILLKSDNSLWRLCGFASDGRDGTESNAGNTGTLIETH